MAHGVGEGIRRPLALDMEGKCVTCDSVVCADDDTTCPTLDKLLPTEVDQVSERRWHLESACYSFASLEGNLNRRSIFFPGPPQVPLFLDSSMLPSPNISGSF